MADLVKTCPSSSAAGWVKGLPSLPHHHCQAEKSSPEYLDNADAGHKPQGRSNTTHKGLQRTAGRRQGSTEDGRSRGGKWRTGKNGREAQGDEGSTSSLLLPKAFMQSAISTGAFADSCR